MDDLLIRGATVIDGSGGAPRSLDVAVRDGRISAVEPRRTETAAQEIDASGRVLAPSRPHRCTVPTTSSRLDDESHGLPDRFGSNLPVAVHLRERSESAHRGHSTPEPLPAVAPAAMPAASAPALVRRNMNARAPSPQKYLLTRRQYCS
jgi:hypothetical protein